MYAHMNKKNNKVKKIIKMVTSMVVSAREEMRQGG
jgi:hypothetical protein